MTLTGPFYDHRYNWVTSSGGREGKPPTATAHGEDELSFDGLCDALNRLNISFTSISGDPGWKIEVRGPDVRILESGLSAREWAMKLLTGFISQETLTTRPEPHKAQEGWRRFLRIRPQNQEAAGIRIALEDLKEANPIHAHQIVRRALEAIGIEKLSPEVGSEGGKRYIYLPPHCSAALSQALFPQPAFAPFK